MSSQSRQLRADGAHEPLGHTIGLRGAERRANDFDPLTPEHVVKLVGEFLVPIRKSESERVPGGTPVLSQNSNERLCG
jgi:hypothetical protein